MATLTGGPVRSTSRRCTVPTRSVYPQPFPDEPAPLLRAPSLVPGQPGPLREPDVLPNSVPVDAEGPADGLDAPARLLVQVDLHELFHGPRPPRQSSAPPLIDEVAERVRPSTTPNCPMVENCRIAEVGNSVIGGLGITRLPRPSKVGNYMIAHR